MTKKDKWLIAERWSMAMDWGNRNGWSYAGISFHCLGIEFYIICILVSMYAVWEMEFKWELPVLNTHYL